MRIAVIGAGNVGGAVARASMEAGHEVVVAARSQDKVERLMEELGVEGAHSIREAVAEAEIVVLAAYFDGIQDILRELGTDLDGKIVIDTSNPVTADLSARAFEDTSGSEIIQEQVPGARVVKAFNTVFAARQAEPTQDGEPLDGFVAGDDEEAKRVVLELLAKIGYRPIDVGPLASARTLEAMAQLNMWLNATNAWPWQSAWKLVGPTA